MIKQYISGIFDFLRSNILFTILFTISIITLIMKLLDEVSYKLSEIKEDKRIISEFPSSLSQNYSFIYKCNWRMFTYNDNTIYVYNDTIENKELLIAIPSYRISFIGDDIRCIIREKENNLKPVNEILKKVSKIEIQEEVMGYCEVAKASNPKIYGAKLFKRKCSRGCNLNCIYTRKCDRITNLYNDLIEIYDNLLKIIPSETNITVGFNKESFENLSILEIVSANYKDSQGRFIGKEERLRFIVNLLLYLYIERQRELAVICKVDDKYR